MSKSKITEIEILIRDIKTDVLSVKDLSYRGCKIMETSNIEDNGEKVKVALDLFKAIFYRVKDYE